MAMRAAILCLAACVCDVMNMAMRVATLCLAACVCDVMNMAMRAAILCLAACVCDVMNMAMRAAILCLAACVCDVMNMAMRAAILCLAACVCDVMNKADLCLSHHEPAVLPDFICKELTNKTAPRRGQIWSKEVPPVHRYWQNNHTKLNWKYLHIFNVFWPICLSVWGPL